MIENYNPDVLTEAEASTYRVYWDERLKGKLGHFDWHLPNLGQISLLNGNANPYDIDEAAWEAVKEKTMSLRPQVGGFFDYGGTFSSLNDGQMLAFCGIGDWITGVLQKNGAKVSTAIPEEGGLQWSECFSIGKGSAKADLAKASDRAKARESRDARDAFQRARLAGLDAAGGQYADARIAALATAD